MQVRNKITKTICSSGGFNMHSMNEIIVGFGDDGMDSDFISNYDVYLEKLSQWQDMGQAFKEHNLIVDNYNSIFFEPKTKEDEIRGFSL